MDLSVLFLDVKHIAPEIVITFTIITVILVDLFDPKGDKSVLAYISLGGIVIAAMFCIKLMGFQGGAFSDTLIIDKFGHFYKLMMFCITGLSLLISIEYVKFRDINQGEFYSLILFANLGMMIMVCGADLLSIYLGLELNTIACCTLVGFLRRDIKSNEAALKYFILSLFSSGVLLYGISLIYGATGSISLQGIAQYLTNPGSASNFLLHLGLVLLIVGFGFKIAYVPFHMWVPDVYEGAPTSVAAFLSLGPKAAGMAALIRIVAMAMIALQLEWTLVFGIIAAVTMTLGNVVALSQTNIKRLLAYSGIAHAGYMLMAFVAAASAPSLSLTSIGFYLFCYTFFNLGPFGLIILLCSKDKNAELIEDFDGLATHHPVTALVMVIFLLSLAGIPPTGGFVGKFLIFAAAVEAKLYWLVMIGVVNSAIALFYYLRIIVAMYVHEPRPDLKLNATPALVFALVIMVGVTLLTGIFPSWFIDFTRSSVASVL